MEPTEPTASPAVQKLLDDAKAHLSEKRSAEALAMLEQALAAARAEKDGAGEAHAQRRRAQALSTLNRTDDAFAAWEATAAAWSHVGDGPGQIEALAAMSALEVKEPDKAAALSAQALKLGASEVPRPLAAAQALRVAGQFYFDHQALGKAREFWSVALSLRERRAPNSLDLAASLSDLGTVAWRLGDLTTALDYFRKTLAIREKLSPGSLEVATTLTNLGTVVARQGDLAAAGGYYRRALAVREEKAPNSALVAASLSGVGLVLAQQGDLAAGREYFLKALAIRQEKAPNSLDVAASLSNLGFVAWRLGDLATALDYFRQTLAIDEKMAPQSLEVASAYQNLGAVAWEQGDMAGAREYYRKSLAIKQDRAPNTLDMASSLNGLGLVAVRQGDLVAAREYLRKATAITQEKAPNSLELATNLNSLGIVALRQGDFPDAGEYFRKALAIQQEKAPGSLEVGGSLGNLGNLAYQTGDLAAARDYYRKALAMDEERAPNSLHVAAGLSNLAVLILQQGDLATAREYLKRALAIYEEKAPNSIPMAEARVHLGELAEKQGNLLEAKENFSRAWQLVQSQAVALSGDEARQAFHSSTQTYAAKLIRSQIALRELPGAFTTLEESRAQALRQLLLDKQGLAKAAGNSLWSEYQVAVAARNRAEQAASKASTAQLLAQRDVKSKERERSTPEQVAKKKFEEAQSVYTQARVKAEALWADIQKSLPHALAPPPLTVDQASHALPNGTLYIAFSVGDEKTDVFLLGSEDRPATLPLSAYTVAKSSKELRRLAEQLRLQLITPSRRTAGTMAGRSLFAELFPKDAQKEIATAHRLLISPDGPLWEVSFAGLVTNASGAPRYLGAAKAITYTPSLSLFAESRSETHKLAARSKASAVVVGNPVFDRAVLAREKKQEVANLTPAAAQGFGERSYLFLQGQPPEPLPETEREAVAVARFYGSAPLLRAQATEAAVRQQIENADVIHLATHGYLHPVRAMSSGILLTMPEKEPEPGETDNDGALQAWEIYSQLKLKADLVVLSACETGRGQEVPGEGLVGLTRALQYAGARSIVASQWKVADQSTATLMLAFHRLLRQGLPKDEALRKAMAQLRQNPATSHPYYWAPFVLVGDPDNTVLAVTTF